VFFASSVVPGSGVDLWLGEGEENELGAIVRAAGWMESSERSEEDAWDDMVIIIRSVVKRNKYFQNLRAKIYRYETKMIIQAVIDTKGRRRRRAKVGYL